MKKSRSVLKRKWDAKLSQFFKASFETIEREFLEHSGFARWVATYILLPLALFYLAFGLVLGQNVFGTLFIGTLVFFYSSFVPDLDTLLTPTKDAVLVRSTRFERLALLFLGPLTIYYLLSKEAKPVYASRPKQFHRLKYLAVYCVFLLGVGILFWSNPIRSFALPVFGALGYGCHLFVDGYLKFSL